MKAATASVKFWRRPDLNNLELMHATYVDQCFSRHTHENFAVGVVEEGTGAFDYRGTKQIAPVSSIFLINPGEVHTGGGFGQVRCTYRVMYPAANLLERLASEAVGGRCAAPFFPVPIVHDNQLAHLIHHLHVTLEDNTSKLEQESLLLRTLAELITRHAGCNGAPRKMGREPWAVRQVRDYLDAHSDENVSLTELTSLTGLSSFRLTRVFSEKTGLPPHAYLTQLRVSRAKTLLAQGYPISQVALEAGFTHQSHLNRHFKRLVGITPGQYRSGKIVQDRAKRNS